MIKKIITSISLLLAVMLPTAIPLSANADSAVNQACAGLNVISGKTSCTKGSDAGVGGIIKQVINIISLIVGFVSVLVIMISGFRFITAGGDQNTVSSARNALMYAIIGLVIAVAAQLIVHLVLNTAVSSVKG